MYLPLKAIETYPEDGVLRGHDGEDLTMKCKITGGSPWPEVTWKRKVWSYF